MKRIAAVSVSALLVLASAGSLVAHHSLAQYETAKAVRVKGTVVLFQRVNPHSIVFLDQKSADGQTQRWAVEGPDVIQLERMGVPKDLLKAGDVIEACGYVTKDGRERTAVSPGPKAATPKSVPGKIMDGEQVILPNGRAFRWSDYGFHHCLGADYEDFHSK